jgi:hypothetical protein
MEAVPPFETLVNLYQTSQSHVQKYVSKSKKVKLSLFLTN